MAQEDKVGGGVFDRRYEEGRRRYDDVVRGDEPKENNWGLKVALFAVLLCACYFIYKYGPLRDKETETDEVERVITPGVFGKGVSVKTLEDYKFQVRFKDGATAEQRVVYKLRPDITQEKINQYDPNVVKAQIREIVQRSAIEMTGMNSYANKGEMMSQLKRQIAQQLNSHQIDLFQTEIHYEQNILKLIERRNEELIRVELALAEANRMEAIAQSEVRINIAKEKISEAEISRKLREQFIIDSMTFIYEQKIKDLHK